MNPLGKKIELTEKAEEFQAKPKKGWGRKFTWRPKLNLKKILIFLGALGILGVLVVVFGILPALQIKDNALQLDQEVRGVLTAIQAQDLNQAVDKLETTRVSFNQLKGNYQKLAWLRVVPFVGGFYQDGQWLIRGGDHLLKAGDIALEALEPYADILGLEREEEPKKPEEMTTEERLMLALDTLDKLQPSFDAIGEELDLARKEINQIDPNRYPETLFDKEIRKQVVVVVKMVDGTAQLVGEIKPIVSYLKPLLGIPEEKKYLLLFQNDAELRPTGGFLTAYAVLSVANGKFKPLGSYDIYGLDARFGNRLKAPESILNYHKNVFYWHLRDMNLSPDFKESMETFWENYRQVGKTDIDGIIALDTKVLVDIFEVLGPIGVADWGNFSAEIDDRCDCPQVFYELERYADKPVGEMRTERKAVIGPLMHSVLLNIMQSPRKKWPEFFNVIFSNIQEKHVLFYFFEEEIQGAVEAMNAAGRIRDYDQGDYLHINDCNFAGAKSNMFIEENVTQEIEVGSDGTATKLLTIDYKNPAPASNCNLEAGELCLNGLYRDWVRVYVPEGSELIEASGSEIEVKTYQDLGKTVFEAFYGDTAPLRPLGKAQLQFKYKLPFKVEKGQLYQMLIQKQPGTYGYEYTVKLNGKEEIFELKTDKELRL